MSQVSAMNTDGAMTREQGFKLGSIIASQISAPKNFITFKILSPPQLLHDTAAFHKALSFGKRSVSECGITGSRRVQSVF